MGKVTLFPGLVRTVPLCSVVFGQLRLESTVTFKCPGLDENYMTPARGH